MSRNWKIVVRHASRERNDVVDSLAAMGRDHEMQGAVFLAPPEALVARAEEEQRSWVALREVLGELDEGFDPRG
ncbi:hypothetical protein V6N12_075647 [Hibiscus sabdariffa]|uniref:RNase H type-1 domain-containing protein n=1 Tax=Hibiscus sabdariffa TaxID=183260 RepID=A0ABR2C881_9ROSI